MKTRLNLRRSQFWRRHRQACALGIGVGCYLATTLAVWSQVLVQFSQTSNPAGMITTTSTMISTGALVSTVSAPAATSGYQFAYWTFNSVPQRDQLGQAINPVVFTIALPVAAVANYLPATADSNTNGVPDWFEMYYLGSLTNAATANADGDAFLLSDEYVRDYNPNIPDTLADGGISQRNSALTTYLTPGYVLYTELSSPLGYVNNQLILPTNTVRILPNVSTAGLAAGYQFAEWRTNGVRVADATGRAIGGLPILVNLTTTNATAVFFPATQDTVGDGVPDWFKFQFYGTTNIAATSDTDGDGWTLLDEYLRDYNPDFADIVTDGGISQRNSALTTYLTPGYVLYTELSSPLGYVNNQLILPTNTVRILPDVSAAGLAAGYQFAEWRTNGVRVADATGRAIAGLPILVNLTTTNATAVFFPATQDTVGDGVPDWFKFQFYGTTNIAATADTDGDGWTLLDEYLRDYNPDFIDIVTDGGISQRVSSQVYVDTRAYTYYWVVTVPSGLFSDFGQVPVGTVVQTTNAPPLLANFAFGHWSINGVSQRDSTGAALLQVGFAVNSNTVATAFYYPVGSDSNGNGLPDWWEDYYFGCSTCADPNADSDGTGMTNLQKYFAGLNPLDPKSILAITSSLFAPDGYELTFPSVSGKVYQVDYKNDLSTTNSWQLLLDDILGDGQNIQIVDPGATALPQRFYRIQLKP